MNDLKILTIPNMVKNVHVAANDLISDKTTSVVIVKMNNSALLHFCATIF